MIGYSAALFFVMLVFAAVGYGFGAYLPTVVIHVFPVAVPLLIMSYIKEFFDKNKGQDLVSRLLRFIIIVWLVWLQAELCMNLNTYYTTDQPPWVGKEIPAFLPTMLQVVGFAAAGILVFLVLNYTIDQMKRIKRRRKREEEKAYFEKIRACKTTMCQGTNG